MLMYCGKIIDVAFCQSPLWYYHYNSKFHCTTRDSFLRTSWLSTTEQTDKGAKKKKKTLKCSFLAPKIFRFCLYFCQIFWLGICSKVSLTCLVMHSTCWLTDQCPGPISHRIWCNRERDKSLLLVSKGDLILVISSVLRKQKGVLRESITSKSHEYC